MPQGRRKGPKAVQEGAVLKKIKSPKSYILDASKLIFPTKVNISIMSIAGFISRWFHLKFNGFQNKNCSKIRTTVFAVMSVFSGIHLSDFLNVADN